MQNGLEQKKPYISWSSAFSLSPLYHFHPAFYLHLFLPSLLYTIPLSTSVEHIWPEAWSAPISKYLLMQSAEQLPPTHHLHREKWQNLPIHPSLALKKPKNPSLALVSLSLPPSVPLSLCLSVCLSLPLCLPLSMKTVKSEGSANTPSPETDSERPEVIMEVLSHCVTWSHLSTHGSTNQTSCLQIVLASSAAKHAG